MHSGELARLAGVTVRALRHYHQVGVLAEPDRDANGYRRYDVHDLIRVLRIRRLASLGVPLEQMPVVLDDAGTESGDLLADLDRELAEQIERLQEQRRLIARLREHRSPPDLPPELAPFFAVFAAGGRSSGVASIDRDQLVLLAHLVGEQGMEHITRFYRRISSGEIEPLVADLAEQFDRIGPATSDADIEVLATTFGEILGPVVAEFSEETSSELSRDSELFEEYLADMLNERQRFALSRLAQSLES